MAGEITGVRTKDGVTRLIDYMSLANRPFGVESTSVLWEDEEFSDGDSVTAPQHTALLSISEGDSATLTVDGTEETYTVSATSVGGDGSLCIGEVDDMGPISDAAVLFGAGGGFVMFADGGTHTVSLSVTTHTRLDARYLPKGLYSAAPAYETVIDEDCEFVEGGK